MIDTILSKWLISTNQLLDKNSDIKPTHLLLDGGRISIKKELVDTFYKLYAECLSKNVPLHIVEQKTPKFKFFSDLDIINVDKISNDEILKIVNLIQEVIYYIYAQDYHVIVCGTESKEITKNNVKFVKQGIHLYWPEICIDCETAITVRKIIIHKLKSILGEREEFNMWDDVVDISVYKNNGIRMIGSSKCSYKNKELIDDKRTYMPIYIVDCYRVNHENKLTELIKNKYLLVKTTSIQIFGEKNILPIINYPEFINNVEYCEPCDMNNETYDSKESSSRKLSSLSPKYKAIYDFFRIHVEKKYPIYSCDEIKKILDYDGKVYVILTKSKYCQNISRSHNSCQIYFKVTPAGLSQKCLCICNTLEGRKVNEDGIQVYCKDYTTQPIECSSLLLGALGWKSPNKNENLISNFPTLQEYMLFKFTGEKPTSTKPKKSKPPAKV